jgi:hypothetical protein
MRPHELTRSIEEAIAKSPNESVQRTRIQGARMSGKDIIIVRATSSTDAELLGKFANDWIPSFLPGAKINKQMCQLMVHYVPTDLNPSEEESLQHICASNPHLNLSREMIHSARWLRKLDTDKPMSSLILTIDNAKVADDIINRGIRILGTACNAEKVRPDLIQCFKCQNFGHQAKSCPHTQDQPKCARCAGDHSTGSNTCERTCGPTKCADIRQCRHIKFSCANCKGPHKSIDKSCPLRQAELAKLSSHPQFHSPYFAPSNDHSSDPTHHHHPQ